MSVFQCKMCGGNLEVCEGIAICECDYCGTTQTISKSSSEPTVNLYNRANYLRMNSEFDKAQDIYEKIVLSEPNDSEAYWGILLCKFGIEYVEDPKTSKKIPTCHKTQFESILADADYNSVIENADISQKELYENEAKKIDKLQKEILSIVNKEKKYDIFICYKEQDEFGNRTEDSILAQELYYELKKKGYRIFFARKTLESKLGSEYEPIIFAALNSAKVMIVLGTKSEHFNAVWVKNEWSRFIHMSKTSKKVIIPAYRGISPYELPTELSVFQSQDMSKIGFMQDLIDGIERCIRNDVNDISKDLDKTSPYNAGLEKMLKNGATYIKLKNYNSAEEVYTNVTKEYPEDYRGWWGLIVCRTRNFTNIILKHDFELDVWFGYIKQLAEPNEIVEVQSQYIDYINKVSYSLAEKEIESVNAIIDKHTSMVNSKKQQIKSLYDKIKERDAKFSVQINNEIEKIKISKAMISKNGTIRFQKKLGAGMFIIGLLISMLKGSNEIILLMGVLIALAGYLFFMFASEYFSFKTLNRIEKEVKENIYNAKKSKSQIRTQYEADLLALNRNISGIENEITVLNVKISKCKKYIELGKDKIKEYIFSKKCVKYGVDMEIDNHIDELRKCVFESSDHTNNAALNDLSLEYNQEIDVKVEC